MKKSRISQTERDEIMSRFSFTTQFSDLSKCDHVVEVVNEDFSLKLKILQTLDEIVPPSATLSSNTSSISITKLAAILKNPARFSGTHFMNPVPKMKIVELIRGLQTSDTTYNRAKA